MGCPDPDTLTAFGRGGLDADKRTEVEMHLDHCESCTWVVSELARVFSTSHPPNHGEQDPPSWSSSLDDDDEPLGSLGETLADEGVPVRTGAKLRPGRRLDRYHILEEVGSGGMGVVYAAYDPDLDRKVALKVLHERRNADNTRAQRRLTREAQSMARLSHPNVITVHEVRVFDDRVFVSMEFVDGGTLGSWLRDTKPSVDQILVMFSAIGRGLAAAHAGGLVHRDIKPDNVLIGTDGRPRVTDFGLARPADDTADPEIALDRASLRDSLRDSLGAEAVPIPVQDATMSRTKGLVGTPAYMAPEQLLHQPATAASDQFSYCVALYEALWGCRPFAGQTLMELAANVIDGVRTEPEQEPAIPRWLRQLVLRGLSRDPADRWPSMTALVERLDSGPRRTRRRLLAAGMVGLTVVGGGLVASQVLSAPSDPCEPVERTLARRWEQGARPEVGSALSRGPRSYAEHNAERVVQRLDDYVAEWMASHRDACEAYHRDEQSDEAFDLRNGCLDGRRRELEALLDVLVEDENEIRLNAVEAVTRLPPIAACNDVEALRTQVAPPRDATIVAHVRRLDSDLARVRALLYAGQYEAGRVLANDVTASARATEYPPIIARALQQRAEAHNRRARYPEAVDDLREAWPLALGAGDDVLAAEAVVSLVAILGHSLARYDLAALRIADAKAMIERVRRRDTRKADALSVSLWFAQGQIDLRHHRYDEALAQFRRALELAEQTTEPESLRVASVLNAAASTRLARGDLQDALEIYQRVLAIRSRHLGFRHPETAHARNNVGLALKNLNRHDEAATQLEQALATLTGSLHADHPSVQMTRLNLAEVLFIQRHYDRAAPLYEAVYGLTVPDGLNHAYAMRRYLHYGSALGRTGRLDTARTILTTARDAARDQQAPTLIRIAQAELARVEVQAGNPTLAMQLLDRLPLQEQISDGSLADISLTRARALAALGNTEAARVLLPEIRQALERTGAPTEQEVAEFAASLDRP